MLLEFRAIGQGLTRADNNYVVAKSVGILKVKFNFSSEWQGARKEAVFQQGIKQAYNVYLDEDDICVVPFQVINVNDFKISCVGTFEDGRIITTNEVKVGVVNSGAMDGISEDLWKEDKKLDLDFSARDRLIVEAEGNKVLKRVTIDKPEQLISDNLVKGVEIAGIKGNYIGEKIIVDTKDLPHMRFWYLNDDFEWVYIEKAVDEETHYCEPPFMEQHINAKEDLGCDLDFDEWSGEWTDVYANRDCIANYSTSDGYTHIFVNLTNNSSSERTIALLLNRTNAAYDLDNPVIVNWGDGSDDTIAKNFSPSHTYLKNDIYEIVLKCNFEYSFFRIHNVSTTRRDTKTQSNINTYNVTAMYFDNNCVSYYNSKYPYDTSDLYHFCANQQYLKTLTLGKNIGLISQFMFYNNWDLKIIPIRKTCKLNPTFNEYLFGQTPLKSIIFTPSNDYDFSNSDGTFGLPSSIEYIGIYDYDFDKALFMSGKVEKSSNVVTNANKYSSTNLYFSNKLKNLTIFSGQTKTEERRRSNIFTSYFGAYPTYSLTWLGYTMKLDQTDAKLFATSIIDSIEICKDVSLNLLKQSFSNFAINRFVINCPIENEELDTTNGSIDYWQGSWVPATLSDLRGLKEFNYPNVKNVRVVRYYDLEKLYVQDKATSIYLDGAYNLIELKCSSSVLEEIALGSVGGVYNKLIDISKVEKVPALTSYTARINPNCKIVVPDALYEEFIVATNWIVIKDNIIKLSDYEKENE